MENLQRNFMAANISESMFSAIRAGGFKIEPTGSNLKELKDVKNLYSSINNCALSGTLRHLGIIGERVDKFQVTGGDCIFTVRAEGLGKPIREYAEDNILPKTCTLVITKYEIKMK